MPKGQLPEPYLTVVLVMVDNGASEGDATMKRTTSWVPLLSALAFLVTTSPALATSGGHGKGHGQSHNGGGKGGGSHHGGGVKGGGGGSKGTPAPIAGLGLLALGAMGYGTRKLLKQKQK